MPVLSSGGTGIIFRAYNIFIKLQPDFSNNNIMTQTLISLPPTPTSQLILHDVSWEMYEKLLDIFTEYPQIRLNYYQGTLELMTPSPEHETYSWNLGRLITILSEELGLEIRGLKSTTWRSPSEVAGKQADECFYIQNEFLVRDKLTINLETDPPPDLAIEVNITHSFVDKFAIYKKLKIPEIWSLQQGKLFIYLLTDEGYQEAEKSLAFGEFPIQELTQFLQLDSQKGENARMREFRQWVRLKLNELE